MARDRKRAKQRQRRAAQRQPQASRSGQRREPEARIDPDKTIPDLEHGSADADIAKASIAAGAVDADEVSQELDEELGAEQPPTGEIFPDEVADDGYESEEAEAAVEGADGVAAARAAAPRRERAARDRSAKDRGGGSRVGGFLRNSWEELKRVQWPDRRQVAQATAVVIGFVIIIGAFLGAADYVFGKLVDAII
ncbi:MAG TPA: preprotein translocase subunit SecE [Solirubrobacteraceae bacterium]|jgi:preprotein translocase SecE subunit|nr:preprotein translocase subunit SecE [Solirubrobacteraceae bacterium]